MKALALTAVGLALSIPPAAMGQTATGSGAPTGSAAGTSASGAAGLGGSAGSKGGTSHGGSRTQDLTDPLNPLSPQTDY